MGEVHDVGGGWKAMEVKGLGVLVAAEMAMTFLPGTMVQDGEIVVMPAAVEASRKKPAASIVSIKTFLDDMETYDLTSSGTFGTLGPVLGKLKGFLDDVEPTAPVAQSIGNLLARGDHARHGSAAGVICLPEDQREGLSNILESGDEDLVKVFVDRAIGAAA